VKYGLEFAGARRRVRRDWRWTVLMVLTLLALAALCGWLLHVMRDAAGPVSGFRFQVSGLPLAMAPVPTKGDGAVLAAVLLGMAGLISLSVLAERKLETMERRKRETRLTEIDEETEERWRRVRRKQREILQRHACETVPRESWTVGHLESLSEADAEIIERLPKPPAEDEGEGRWGAVEAEGKNGSEGNDDFSVSPSHSLPVSQSLGLPAEDAHLILVACAAEGRAIMRRLVRAQDVFGLDLVDHEQELELAEQELAAVIRCVEALAERMGAGERAKARTTNEGRAA
jgi:hypothetical protein